MQEVYMVADNEGNTYINNCSQDCELLKISPEDYYKSKYRGGNGKLSAESILSKFSKTTIKEKGYKLVKFTVGFAKQEDVEWSHN